MMPSSDKGGEFSTGRYVPLRDFAPQGGAANLILGSAKISPLLYLPMDNSHSLPKFSPLDWEKTLK